MNPFQKITYADLADTEQEAYNFQKAAAVFADYGYTLHWLIADDEGPDFLAFHFNRKNLLQVQLKGRLTFDKKYSGKELWICFPHRTDGAEVWYCYPHDELLAKMERLFSADKTWQAKASWNAHTLSKEMRELLEPYKR